MFTKQYWNERAQQHGHTGHSEPFYYCFDQEARRFAIHEIINALPFQQKEKALDFGCGSGDFIQLLMQNFKSVSAYDFSESVLKIAKRRFTGNTPVFLSHHFNEIENEGTYDLILSVTVLQYLNKAALDTTLQKLASQLNKGAYLISLDAFSTAALNKEHHTDKATVQEWQDAVKTCSLTQTAEFCFYNPVLYPSPSWKIYNNNLLLKCLKPFKHLKVVKAVFSNKARQIIYSQKDILHDQNSIFKIYILQK